MEKLFTFLTHSLTGSFGLALAGSFIWGILSILLSPCHLSSIPLIVGYVSSRENVNYRSSFGMALIFAVGILITIALIGVITASLGRMMGDVGKWGNWIVAGIFFLVGLYLMDILKVGWAAPSLPRGLTNWTGALVLGLIFGIGLGPCTFAYFAPILSLVFNIATSNWLKALLLISAFGLGHCLLIVFAGTMTPLVQKYLNWTNGNRVTIYIKRIAGSLVFLGGVYFIYTAF